MARVGGVDNESFLGTPSISPFSPHFGKSPLSMVGRDLILSSLGDGLVSGPNDKRYTSILLGVRGSGKTVTLNELEDRAVRDGWVVLSMDASTVGLLDRIVGAVEHAERTVESLNMNHTQTLRTVEKSIGIKLGPVAGRISTTHNRDPHTRVGIRDRLAGLADAAHSNGTSVLLSVDEIHSIDPAEARRLANDLQHITRREGKPLAFVAAGLPSVKHTLLRDRKLTFLGASRLRSGSVGRSCAQVRNWLRRPTVAAIGYWGQGKPPRRLAEYRVARWQPRIPLDTIHGLPVWKPETLLAFMCYRSKMRRVAV